MSGIVLAGGRSRRMGGDKCGLEIEGRSLIRRVVDALDQVVDEVLIVAARGWLRPVVRSSVPVRDVVDPIEDGGPLVAIAAGLEEARAPVALVAACDLPFLEPALLRLLAEQAAAGASLVVPVHQGRPQFLCSAWRRDALPKIEQRIAAGDRAVADAAAALGAELMPPEVYASIDATGRLFCNVNTPEQLAAARRSAREAASR